MEIVKMLTSLQVPVTTDTIEIRWHIVVKDLMLMVT